MLSSGSSDGRGIVRGEWPGFDDGSGLDRYQVCTRRRNHKRWNRRSKEEATWQPLGPDQQGPAHSTKCLGAADHQCLGADFTGANGDGAQPISGLVADASGNLYGTSITGGLSGQRPSALFGTSCGVVFELMPPTSSGGTWTEKILHKFTGGGDGAQPWAGLIPDSASL